MLQYGVVQLTRVILMLSQGCPGKVEHFPPPALHEVLVVFGWVYGLAIRNAFVGQPGQDPPLPAVVIGDEVEQHTLDENLGTALGSDRPGADRPA